MIDRLLEMLSGRHKPEAGASPDDQRLAVAALLVEAARMDQNFDDGERDTIANLLKDRFELTSADATELINKADGKVQDTAQYFPFTHHINQTMSETEKVEVIEMLWQVAYADGTLDEHEDQLIRQLAGLIYVTDRDRMQARKRALAKGG